MKRDRLDAEIDAARKRGERKFATEPRAIDARYDGRSGRVSVELSNGCTLVFPARALQGLDSATDAELAKVEVAGVGYGLHWPTLDADFLVLGLLRGVFGSSAWMAKKRARRAGFATLPAKPPQPVATARAASAQRRREGRDDPDRGRLARIGAQRRGISPSADTAGDAGEDARGRSG